MCPIEIDIAYILIHELLIYYMIISTMTTVKNINTQEL